MTVVLAIVNKLLSQSFRDVYVHVMHSAHFYNWQVSVVFTLASKP